MYLFQIEFQYEKNTLDWRTENITFGFLSVTHVT